MASAERSFNKLTLFKEFDKLTMSQERLADLSMMAIGSYNARRIDFEKPEQLLVKVHKPIKPSSKHELLICGRVKVAVPQQIL